MQVGWVKIGDFWPIAGYISKTVQDRHIVSIKVEWEVVCALSNGSSRDGKRCLLKLQWSLCLMNYTNNNNNNNKCICIAPQGRNFRGAGARQCATEKREERALEKRNVFSLDLTDSNRFTVIDSFR